MTQLTRNPLASPPAPRGMRYAPASEPVRKTWLEMATDEFQTIPTSPPTVDAIACVHLRAAIQVGYFLAKFIESNPNIDPREVVDSPVQARRLRLYLGAVDGLIEYAADLEQAEQLLGIRGGDLQLNGAWL